MGNRTPRQPKPLKSRPIYRASDDTRTVRINWTLPRELYEALREREPNMSACVAELIRAYLGK